MTAPSILLFGATGNIGQHILRAIITSKSNFSQISIFTSPTTVQSKAPFIASLTNSNVHVLMGDVTSRSDVVKACQGYDVVISAVGRGVIASQIELISWIKEAGVKWFFPSEYGTDIKYGPKSKDEKPHQAKLKVRENLEKSGLDYTYVVVGPYPEMFLKSVLPPEYGSFDVKEKKAVLLGDGEEKVGFTAMPDVGKFVVAALLHPEVSKNRALIVNSFTTTPHEIVKEFEKQTNSKWTVTYTSLDDLRKLEEESWEKGHPSAASMTLRRIWTEGGTLYDKMDNEELGVKETDTLKHQVKLVIEGTQ